MKPIGEDRYAITSNSALKEAASYWQQQSCLGIDTEFIRTDTFYPRPALIQVSDGRQCWLVDVLCIDDFTPMAAVMGNPAVYKLVHAAGEDLDVFDRLLGVLPQPLFDTQVAAAFCGHGPSIGYSRLVEALLGIPLSKDQCRSDWLARPLTEEQQHYACLDVLYLPALHKLLESQLQHESRHDWLTEENGRVLQRYQEARQAPYSLDRFPHAWRLDESQRRRLWHLVLGRDALARHHDRPRTHIAKDFALFEMARRPPAHVAALAGMEGLRPSAIRQFGEHLVELANHVPDDLACPDLPAPLGRLENDRVRQLRQVVEDVARQHGLPPELLVRKQELEHLVRQYSIGAPASGIILPERYRGWREPLLGQPLRDCIRSWG